MEKYLLPEDDGLPTRSFGKWVAEKLYYLKRYIAMFETSMRERPWRGRNYIDLFAGSGKCYVSETGDFHLGSPLLALTVVDPELLKNEELYFNAARLDRSMALKTSDYLALSKPRVEPIAAPLQAQEDAMRGSIQP